MAKEIWILEYFTGDLNFKLAEIREILRHLFLMFALLNVKTIEKWKDCDIAKEVYGFSDY